MMNKVIVYGAGVIVVTLSIIAYAAKMTHDAEVAEREKIRIELIADTNQKIAERRVTDAKFDKMDAADFCSDAGLTWVFDNQRSHCE